MTDVLTENLDSDSSDSTPDADASLGTSHSRLDQYAQYAPLLRCCARVILSSLFVPALLIYLAWELGPPFEKVTLKGAICSSLIFSIPLFFIAILIHRTLVPEGLAERFLGWRPTWCDALLRTTTRLVWICLPLQTMYTALEWFEGGQWNDSLGRGLFLWNMAVFAAALYQTRRTLCKTFSRDVCPNSYWTRFSLKLGMAAAILMPLALLGLSAAGYHFTAVQLSWRLFWSFCILMSVALTTSFVGRLLLTAQFRIKLRQLQDHDQSESNDSIKISEISAQVNHLLRVTALIVIIVISWQIWSGVLPAIGYLDQVGLWQAAGDFAVDGVPQMVTLRHVLVAAGIIGIMFVLSRNLPGLLEIVLLERLPLDRGGRYAISFVMRYMVGVVGLLMACKWLGFSWNSVQWLAAGLSVGLGFGLQEIFANLVSGIIILIERPVRVGDFVTVNGVTGTVSRMQLRATTIRDLDHRELIVPNKRFITDDVMNWTLTDSINRVIFKVGIAYGSDTRLAQRTLEQVAYQSPRVLKEPRPEVVFTEFGDSSLNFELKVAIPRRDQYFVVLHELNMAIDAAFRRENIEIAFPQQDVHLHGLPESISGTAAKSVDPALKVSEINEQATPKRLAS